LAKKWESYAESLQKYLKQSPGYDLVKVLSLLKIIKISDSLQKLK
jgi:hypothetical protein